MQGSRRVRAERKPQARTVGWSAGLGVGFLTAEGRFWGMEVECPTAQVKRWEAAEWHVAEFFTLFVEANATAAPTESESRGSEVGSRIGWLEVCVNPQKSLERGFRWW